MGRISRVQALGLGEAVLELFILETVLELHLLFYPLSMIRALLHSVSASPGVSSARRGFRAWAARVAMSNQKKGKGNYWKDSYNKGYYRHYSPPSRHRSSSSKEWQYSSSSKRRPRSRTSSSERSREREEKRLD